jgi:acyl carrier protein
MPGLASVRASVGRAREIVVVVVSGENVEEQVAAEPSSGSINTRGDVLELVRNQLAEILEIEPGEIAESASFADDLNADSLALIELVEALEESLRDQVAGFRIEDDDLEDLRTVRDAVDYVTAKI